MQTWDLLHFVDVGIMNIVCFDVSVNLMVPFFGIGYMNFYWEFKAQACD